MKMVDRVKAAAAALRGKGFYLSRTADLNALLDFLGVDRGLAGDVQSEAVYFACLKVLSEAIGKLPLKIQQARPGEGIRVAHEHPYYRMLNERTNRHMTASVFWSTLELCRNDAGNAYAWIDTRNPERPQLWPLNPHHVQVWYDDGLVLADAPDVYYLVSTPRGIMTLGSEDVLHFKSHNTRDGLVGISVRDQLASTIQGNAKAQAYINKLYENGMTAKVVLQYTGSLNDANVQALKEGIEN